MDRDRFSFLAHATLAFANPLPASAIDRALEIVAPRPGTQALDIGCGKAELLIRLAEQHGVRGIGVERSRLAFDEGIRIAMKRAADLVELHHANAADFVKPLAPASFDLTICIGATHALG